LQKFDAPYCAILTKYCTTQYWQYLCRMYVLKSYESHCLFVNSLQQWLRSVEQDQSQHLRPQSP